MRGRVDANPCLRLDVFLTLQSLSCSARPTRNSSISRYDSLMRSLWLKKLSQIYNKIPTSETQLRGRMCCSLSFHVYCTWKNSDTLYNSLYGGLTIQFLLIPDETLMKHKKYLLLTCKIMRCMYKSQVALLSLIPRLLVTSSLVSDRPAGGKLLKKECFFTSLCHIKYKWRKDDIQYTYY